MISKIFNSTTVDILPSLVGMSSDFAYSVFWSTSTVYHVGLSLMISVQWLITKISGHIIQSQTYFGMISGVLP